MRHWSEKKAPYVWSTAKMEVENDFSDHTMRLHNTTQEIIHKILEEPLTLVMYKNATTIFRLLENRRVWLAAVDNTFPFASSWIST